MKNKEYLNDRKFVFGLYGAGGFAREIMPFTKKCISEKLFQNSMVIDEVFFIETEPNKKEINTYPLISEQDFFSIQSDEKYFNVAIGNSKTRNLIANQCIAKGAIPISIQSPHAIIYDCNEIGDGAIICAHAMITSNSKIGKFFHANIYSYVAHDCVIGDYVTFAPDVHCNGNIHIHDHAYIGTGAVLKQGTPSNPLIIGEGAVIGMGAVVTKNVEPFTTVVGSPARPLNTK
jgi:sugar O-acyltransferase (sialic acid O-acetyltransferase NeuD family)